MYRVLKVISKIYFLCQAALILSFRMLAPGFDRPACRTDWFNLTREPLFNTLLVLVLLISTSTYGQKRPETTKSFKITGEIKSERTVKIDELASYRESALGDVVITNHVGEVKSQQKKLMGVLLRDILEKVEIKSEIPRDLSACYVVCKATDGYTIVYSWNEIFNNPSGESIYIITSKDGVLANEMEESILMLSPRDYKTGRRYLKGLTSIEIKRVL